MDEELKWNIHIQEVETKATKFARVLASLAWSAWGMRFKDMGKIYQATILPPIITVRMLRMVPIMEDTGLGCTQNMMNTLKQPTSQSCEDNLWSIQTNFDTSLRHQIFLLPVA